MWLHGQKWCKKEEAMVQRGIDNPFLNNILILTFQKKIFEI